MTAALISPFPRGDVPESGIAYASRALRDRLAAHGRRIVVVADRDGRRGAEPGVERCWNRNPLCAFQIARGVRELRADVALVEHSPFAFGEGLANTYNGLLVVAALRAVVPRVVVELHDLRALTELDAGFAARRGVGLWRALRAGYFAFFAGIAYLADALIVHDEIHASRLRSDYRVPARKIHTIGLVAPESAPIAKDDARRMLSLGETETVVLSFGYATAYKGLETLAEAAGRIDAAASAPRLRLVVVAGKNPHLAGNEEYERWYAALAASFARSPRCRFTGFVPDHEVDAYFAACDALVLPYTDHFGSSFPATRALALGKAVLFSERIAPPDLPAQLRFVPSAEALAEKLVALDDAPGLQALGERYATSHPGTAGVAAYEAVLDGDRTAGHAA